MAEIKRRMKKNGKVSYTACIRIKGYDTLTATFERLTDVKTWVGENESKMKRGKKIKSAEATRHTLAELIDRYIIEELPNRNSDHAKFKMQLGWWKDKIGACLLSDVTPSLLSQCKDVLSKEPSLHPVKGNTIRAGATVNRYMACLSIVLSLAANEWEWLEENPMLKVSKKKESRGRVRFLSEEEKVKLLTECKKISYELYLFVLIAITSGARYGEIIKLQWQNIDFVNRIYHFLDTKNGDDRGVSISKVVYEELKKFAQVRNIKSDYIFANKDGKLLYLTGKFKKAVELAGIEDFRFHDLRHTAASYLAMNGASLLEIAEVLGHKTLAMVKRYSHLTRKHTADLIDRMSEKEFGNLG